MSGRGRGRGRGRGGGLLGNNFADNETQEAAAANGVPQQLYPDFDVPTSRAPMQDEKLQVRYLKEVQASIMSETPFYVQVREKVTGTLPDGIERYSDRWQAKQKTTQSLLDLRTDDRFFPEELLPVLHGDVAGRKKRKQQKFDLNKFLEMNVEPEADVLDNSSVAGDGKESEEEVMEEEDEAFSEDGNDYEQNYFSGGENDFEDIGDNEDAF